MKKKLFLVFLIVFFIFHKICYSQQPFLTIYYYYGEKSKDSHSSTENISINGNAVSYSVKYSGRRGPNQKNEEKTCTLTHEQLEKINKMIKEKHLDVTDSIIINNESHNSGYQISTNVIITLERSGTSSRAKCKGNPSDLADKPLYKNSLYLLRTIKEMLKLCQ
jgi:hypothetical protein